MRIKPVRIARGQQQLPGPVGFGQGRLFGFGLAGGRRRAQGILLTRAGHGRRGGFVALQENRRYSQAGFGLRRLFARLFCLQAGRGFGLLRWDGLGLLLRGCDYRRHRLFARSGNGRSFTLGFRMTRFLVVFALAAVLVLPRAGSFGFFGVLPLPPLALAGLGFRRGVFGFVRAARRTVRAAGFTAFPERGFFVFIPGNDPFGGCRILSDAPNITAAAWPLQREFALAP